MKWVLKDQTLLAWSWSILGKKLMTKGTHEDLPYHEPLGPSKKLFLSFMGIEELVKRNGE